MSQPNSTTHFHSQWQTRASPYKGMLSPAQMNVHAHPYMMMSTYTSRGTHTHRHSHECGLMGNQVFHQHRHTRNYGLRIPTPATILQHTLPYHYSDSLHHVTEKGGGGGGQLQLSIKLLTDWLILDGAHYHLYGEGNLMKACNMLMTPGIMVTKADRSHIVEG